MSSKKIIIRMDCPRRYAIMGFISFVNMPGADVSPKGKTANS